jgi:phosphoribosylformimino-5-aminoimidazole carboxamide ribotide isomerase
MRILPAIDIRGGNCVRLLRGDYDRETVFGNDPAAMAERWLEEGARALHIVDLDGARDGSGANHGAVRDILAAVAARAPEDFPTELGGGIRDLAGIERWLELGLSRVILGTAAVQRPELVSEASVRFPGRVWVGIDARAGRVAVDGWTRTSDRMATELAREMAERGAGGIVYTDIDRDGTGDGVNVEATAEVARAAGIAVIASGGVHSAEDVRRVRAVAEAGITGIIVGRALYDGAVTLAELEAAAA